MPVLSMTEGDEFLMRLFVTRNIIFFISLVIIDTIFKRINKHNLDHKLKALINVSKVYKPSIWFGLFFIASLFHLVKFLFFKNHFQNITLTIGAALHSGLAVTAVAFVYSIFRKPNPLIWVIIIAATINPLLVRIFEPLLFKLFF